jgi:uncharacterized protein YndB with AHSA1/START domain
MVDILHRIGIESSSPDDTYDALATRDGLAAWWTNDTQGDSGIGETIRFRFGEKGGFEMRVLELDPSRRVLWEVVEGPAEWIGTTVRFELRQESGYTIVLFAHRGWKEPVEFMHHCSTKWATFLMSLKSLVETGKGDPWPNDVQISDRH